MPAKPTSVNSKNSYTLFLFFLFIPFLISACGLDVFFREQVLESANNSSNSTQNVIEFIAHLSTPLFEGESLALDVVDELQGIANNITRYHMTKLNNDLTYIVVISGLENTTLTYRYSKVGAISSSEVNTSGSFVRYRMAHFSGNLHIDDIIAGWNDGDYQGLTGSFTGSVINRKTKLPVADVLICVAGRQFFTNPDGTYTLLNIPLGTHNFVAYPIDGAYQVFQQQVNISYDQQTSVLIELEPNQIIKVKFDVTSPVISETETLRIGGSNYQLGNTFADMNKGLSLQSSLMPSLERVSAQRYQLEIDLYAGSEIRYFYSLGDGFWNIEQDLETILGYRQLILPQKDITIKNTVTSWMMDEKTFIQFKFEAPQDTPENDTVSIQFKTDDWFEPIPMKQGQDNRWYFTLYSPLLLGMNLSYRYCRNNICGNLAETQQELDLTITPISNPIMVSSQLTHWKAYEVTNEPTQIIAADIQKKGENYLTGVEFLSDFNPSYLPRIPLTLDELANKGVNTIVLQPTISVDISGSVRVFSHKPGVDLLTRDLENIIIASQLRNMEVILMPKLNLVNYFPNQFFDIKKDGGSSALELALFDQLLSYAQLAEKLQLPKYILNPSSFSTMLSDEFDNKSTLVAEDYWIEIINQCKKIYTGKIVLAIPYTQMNDENENLIRASDAIYIILNKPFYIENDTEIYIDYRIAASLVLRNEISKMKEQFAKPIYIGISYPSDGMLISSCNTRQQFFCLDFSPINVQSPLVFDQQVQVDFYNALLSEIMACPCVDGVFSRSFFYPLKLSDQSSSIYGKPAMDVLWYWYTGIK